MSETPKTDEQLAEILDNNVQDVTKHLNDISLSELARLRAMEAAADSPRTGVLKAIDDQFADTEKHVFELEADVAHAQEQIEAGGKEERGEQKVAPWKDVDYVGPLTGEQAAWRNENIVLKDGKRVYKKDVEDAESK